MTQTNLLPVLSLMGAAGVQQCVNTTVKHRPPIRALHEDGSLNAEGHLAENVRRLLLLLEQTQITQVTVTFSGDTHAGECQEVLFAADGDRNAIKEPRFSYRAPVSGDESVYESTEMTLNAAVARLVVDFLDAINPDRNTGSYGDFVIDIEDRALEMAVYGCGSDATDKYYCSQEFAADGVN